jgi:hypothetical protein
MANSPHLNCPYCPAQAFGVDFLQLLPLESLQKYKCPSGHIFYVKVEKDGTDDEL